MWLVAPGRRDRAIVKLEKGSLCRVAVYANHVSCQITPRKPSDTVRLRGYETVTVRGYLRFQQRNGVGTACFTQVVQRKSGALSRMHGRIALHVWQSKIGLAVPSVGRS